MSGNFQKTPLAASLQQVAMKRAADAIKLTGKGLPCSVVAIKGSVVTVKFEVTSPFTLPQIKVPKAESQWIRSPTQIGDTGMVIPADAYLGGISGLGGGTATLAQTANLTALVWVPVASTNFASVNTNAVVLYGPDGAVMRDQANTASVTVLPNQITVAAATSITLQVGSKVVTLNSSGLTIDGILFDTHTHPYIPGSGAQTETGTPQ